MRELLCGKLKKKFIRKREKIQNDPVKFIKKRRRFLGGKIQNEPVELSKKEKTLFGGKIQNEPVFQDVYSA